MGLARGTVVTSNGDRPAAHLKVPGMPGRDEQARPVGRRSETAVFAACRPGGAERRAGWTATSARQCTKSW